MHNKLLQSDYTQPRSMFTWISTEIHCAKDFIEHVVWQISFSTKKVVHGLNVHSEKNDLLDFASHKNVNATISRVIL